MSELRKNILDESKRVVIKIGSRILVDSAKCCVRTRYIQRLADSVAQLMEAGKEVVLVTSGAVATGMAELGYKEKPTVMAEKQACAAVGQIDLIYAYREMFRWVQLSVGQILLSADDFRNRQRYKNLQNTIEAMLAHKIVPIINENDSLAVAEIKVGDNDKLSSDVALFLDADLLLIFTDENGLFDDNPKKNPKARLLRFVPEITPAVLALAGKPGEAGSAVSTGGMRSKLEAIRNVTKSGCNAFLANGLKVLPHEVVFENAEGTFFAASKKKLNSRQRWLSFVTTPRGSVLVDDGGVKALREKHSSLLPVGVVQVQKHFDKGDLIEVLDLAKNPVARGVAKFDSETLKLVMKKKTSQVKEFLGKDFPEELIHKNDLVVF
ncbi:glutamate 5-kinase [Fibrobacter intestinalis]|uniref:Glutamate 5-kinase n=1 Tax=Fibrobacter intestinalis TaxID=28122 RepID=A0A1M6TP40_9BACT|nr:MULTISPECIES: glutamate 5-kinase [Fibrobacter]MDD7298618.1 glutamate 5-kinase [Fibrobacter intestinalis]PBC68341.1 glutamate 5-kinase [Fibrobacter sp. UWS1]SHK58683.1 glutamate 5-kinase [Fibrobacter intestinalis]